MAQIRIIIGFAGGDFRTGKPELVYLGRDDEAAQKAMEKSAKEFQEFIDSRNCSDFRRRTPIAVTRPVTFPSNVAPPPSKQPKPSPRFEKPTAPAAPQSEEKKPSKKAAKPVKKPAAPKKASKKK